MTTEAPSTGASTGTAGGRSGRPTRAAVHLLARQRSASDALRARATAVAAAGVGAVLLVAASVAGIRDTAVVGTWVEEAPDRTTTTTAVHEAGGGLFLYLADPGLRPGALLAAVLLLVPFLVLVGQALRVGGLAAHQRESLLALAGATPRDLLRLRVASTTTAFLRGGVWAGPGYAALWVVVGLLPPGGFKLLPELRPWLLLVWGAVVLLLGMGGAVAGALSGASWRRRTRRSSGPARSAPRAAWAWASGAGAAVLIVWLHTAPSGSELFDQGRLLLALLLVLVCAAVLVTRRAARPEGRAGRRDAAVAVLARAQLRGDPTAAGAAAAVLVLCGACVGVCSVLFGYAAAPSVLLAGDALFYLGAGLPVAVAGAGAVVALLSLALSLTDHLTRARRAVSATAALGAETDRLVAVQARALSATAVPAAVGGALVGGAVFAALLLVGPVLRSEVDVVGVTSAVVVGAAAAGAVAAAASHLAARVLAGRVRGAAALEHLRTP